MIIVWGIVITAAVTCVAVVSMLVVRRGAPDGSYFADGDRASGVFGSLATGFALLLGFIIFLAFSSYDQSRSGAEDEALMVQQQVETAQLFPRPIADEFTGELVCYARSVVNDEWDRMRTGSLGDHINPWGVALFGTLQTVEPKTNREQSAYDAWLSQTSEREAARTDRVHGATGIIPSPVWIVLFAVAALIFVFLLFFADRGERKKTQALLMGAVTASMVMSILVLYALDNPFHSGAGGLDPVAMQRSLTIVDEALDAVDRQVPIPCDREGVAQS